MKKIVIRADADVNIGIGHVMRCIALGQMLKDHGYQIHFLTTSDNTKLLDKIVEEDFTINQLFKDIDILDDARITAEYANTNNIKWIITDGYKFNTDYQLKIKYSNLKLCCIDDISNCHYVSDIVLNQNLNAKNIFTYSCEEYTKLLLGIDYVMLRREFRDIKNVPFTHWETDRKKLLITIGGSDYNNYSLKTLNALIPFITYYKIKLVLGSAYPYYNMLHYFIFDNKLSVELLQNVNNMVSLYEWADVTLTAGGSTVWELLKMQKRIITIVVADNQEKIANELHSEKISYNIGRISEIDEGKLGEIINNCIINSKIDSNKIKVFSDQIGCKMPAVLINFLEG